MIKILTYSLFESRVTLVDRKIQIIKDLVLDLEDIGLTTEIWKENKKIVLLIDDNAWISNISDDNYYNSHLLDLEIISDFEETLKSYGMNFRHKYGAGDKVWYEFDKWSKMTKSPLLEKNI